MNRRVLAATVAFVLAACSAQATAPRPSATPTASEAATPRPTNAANDVVYVRYYGRTAPAILALDARTGETRHAINDGAVSSDTRTVYWPESASGGTKTTFHVTDLATGTEIRTFMVDGDLRPAGNSDSFEGQAGGGRVSGDGSRLALMNNPYKIEGDWVTRLAVVDTLSGRMVASAEFRGQSSYGFVAMAPDGRSIFLEQYGEGATRTRVFDVASGTLVDPTGEGQLTSGFRTSGVVSPDKRWLYRFDAGSATTNCTSTDGPTCVPNGSGPYVVALDLLSRSARVLKMPVRQGSADFEKYMLWSLTITPDGSTLYAANPALGVVNEIDARQLSLRRTASITIARPADSIFAAIGQALFPVADAKRFLIGGAMLSPDGKTLYAAAYGGVAVIDTASLASRAVWQKEHAFDTLRLSNDGQRLYAMDNAAGALFIIDAASGTSLGSIKLQYVPAILRIDG